jgi:hypothetical protein
MHELHDNLPRQIDLDRLPNLRGVFQALLAGRHVSSEDFNLYHELQDRETVYESLLAALGYTLVADSRGFYYLVPDDGELTMNATTQKMSLLVFVLIDVLADLGRDPVDVVRRGTIDLSSLPAMMAERYGELLEEGGFPTAESIGKYFATVFARLGFASVNGNVLRFRPPV